MYYSEFKAFHSRKSHRYGVVENFRPVAVIVQLISVGPERVEPKSENTEKTRSGALIPQFIRFPFLVRKFSPMKSSSRSFFEDERKKADGADVLKSQITLSFVRREICRNICIIHI